MGNYNFAEGDLSYPNRYLQYISNVNVLESIYFMASFIREKAITDCTIISYSFHYNYQFDYADFPINQFLFIWKGHLNLYQLEMTE